MLAIISGASRGIGKAMAFAFAKEGYDLAIGARSLEQLKKIQQEIQKEFPERMVFIKKIDFSLKEEIKTFASEVLSQWEKADVIVNNVGVFFPGKLSLESDEAFEKHLDVNLKSAWYLTRPFLEGMKKAKKGFIFNICSVSSKEPRMDAASYSVSKMGLYGFSKVLSEEMRAHGIKVTAILPGSVNTSSWKGLNAPLETFIQPGDVANAAIAAMKNSTFAFTEEIILKPLDRKW